MGPYSPLFLKSPVKFLYSPIPMMAEKNQEEAPMPSCSLEKDPIQDNTRFKLSRSISLSRIDQDYSNQEGSSQSLNTKKRKEPPSPKGKFCVKTLKQSLNWLIPLLNLKVRSIKWKRESPVSFCRKLNHL